MPEGKFLADELGWKPPVIYDPITDSHRVATQKDVDQLQDWNKRLNQILSDLIYSMQRQGYTVAPPRA